MESPSPWDVRTARHNTGMTMAEAGRLVFVSRDVWLSWERDPDHSGHVKMPPAYAQLFALKTGMLKVEDICPHLSILNEQT